MWLCLQYVNFHELRWCISRKCRKPPFIVDIIFAIVDITLTLESVPRSSLFYEFCDIYTLLAYLNSPPFFTIWTNPPKNTSAGKTHINLWFMMRAFFSVIVPILQNDPLLFLSTSRWQSRHTTTQLSRLPSFLPSTWWNWQCLQCPLQ